MSGQEQNPNLCPLTAAKELEVLRLAPRLLPFLLGRGLPPRDALPLAHNAALLSLALEGGLTPRQVLERHSLAEIAALCELYEKEAAL